MRSWPSGRVRAHPKGFFPLAFVVPQDCPVTRGVFPSPPSQCFSQRSALRCACQTESDFSLNDFSALGLAQPLLRALAEEGYSTPTPIQAQAIPDILIGRDLLGIAQTGTGKTAAFALPLLHRLTKLEGKRRRKACRVLVLSPTRELASQICGSFKSYGRHLPLISRVAFGGVPIERQIRSLDRGVDVLVATPGRLLDLTRQRALDLGHVEMLVLDEADQMLDMGFIQPIRQIVQQLPRQRQSLFFSATMPKTIAALASELLTDPCRVEVTPVASTAERVAQRVILVDGADKRRLLSELLGELDYDRTLVFARTKHGADKIARHLTNGGIEAEAIHGNRSQSQRERTLRAFRSGQLRVLVATDIAARGIDVEGVSHVINYDLPNIPESYVHRIGRTARAGASGEAISFCNAEERAYLRSIERLVQQKLPLEDRRRGGESDAHPGAPVKPSRAGKPGREAQSSRSGKRARAGGAGGKAIFQSSLQDGSRPQLSSARGGRARQSARAA